MYSKSIDGPKYRKKCLRQKLQCCAACGYSKHLFCLVVHHIDEDRENDDLDNLIPMCRSCHRRVHNTSSYGGRIDELSEELQSEVVELPDSVADCARDVRDEQGLSSIGKAVKHMVNEGSCEV